MVIVEDSSILREGLVQLLTDMGFVVLRAVGDAVTLEEAIEAEVPDVTVVDIRMPPTYTAERLRAARRLRQSRPAVGILMFSQQPKREGPSEQDGRAPIQIFDPLRSATSRSTIGRVVDTADLRGEGLEERSKLTADVLVGDQPVLVDHRVGDGYFCAGLFDDLSGGVAKDRTQ